MRFTLAFLALALLFAGQPPAQAETMQRPSGAIVPPAAIMCWNGVTNADGSQQVVPCGTQANPLPVTAVSSSTSSVYQEATITTGGTAQNLFASATPANGFELINTSASEILYFRENGTATSAGAASPALAPNASYISPRGYKPTGPISVIGASTGHGIVARAY